MGSTPFPSLAPALVAGLRRDAHAVNPPAYVFRVQAPGGRIIDVPDLQRQRYPDIRPLDAVARAARRQS